MDNVKNLCTVIKRETVSDPTIANKCTNTVCASLTDFASVNVAIEKCEENAICARRVDYKNNSNFNSALKKFLKLKVKDLLRISNDASSKYYITEFKSVITLAVYVRNTCRFGVDITTEILKLCDTSLIDDVVITLNNNI